MSLNQGIVELEVQKRFVMKNQRHNDRHHVGLILTLVGLIGAAAWLLNPPRLASAQGAAPSWSYTGNLNTGRSSYTATLLANGKVLVAGGTDPTGYNPFNSAELYDPATGTWSYTGNLNKGRYGHTATLLPNGKVLVAGGVGDCTPTGGCRDFKSAELYDPATGTWSITGNLNDFYSEHTATLLQNGKVLVAQNTAELYDPTNGTWSYTAGRLNTLRVGHSATLLTSGKVLVTGGKDNFNLDGDPLNSAELYDPATGTWSYTGNLISGNDCGNMTLLPNGKVLIVGGMGAELYDPIIGTWSGTGNPASGMRAVLLSNDKVLAAGGGSNGNGKSAELYDPPTGTWSHTASLNLGYPLTATLLLNGKVLVTEDSAAELYDPGISSTPNQIDDTQFFVRQHYRDFLNREPDPDGLAFWTNEIYLCGGEAQCVEVKRINDSASFFLSIEFQQTGYLVYRVYKASYGDLPNAPVPIKLDEFLPDTQEIGKNVIVKQTSWEETLENNKQAFTAEFVQRQRFVSAYPTSLSPDALVDALFTKAGVTPASADRSAAIADFGSATNTADTAARARALRRVAENSTLAPQEINRAFVLMQYFGYLRRNPNDAPEATLDFQGYNFWMDKLNSFNGNFIQAEMVKAFLSSSEYRRRFSP